MACMLYSWLLRYIPHSQFWYPVTKNAPHRLRNCWCGQKAPIQTTKWCASWALTLPLLQNAIWWVFFMSSPANHINFSTVHWGHFYYLHHNTKPFKDGKWKWCGPVSIFLAICLPRGFSMLYMKIVRVSSASWHLIMLTLLKNIGYVLQWGLFEWNHIISLTIFPQQVIADTNQAYADHYRSLYTCLLLFTILYLPEYGLENAPVGDNLRQ